MPTISQQALQFASSFEAEIFVHLLLRNWRHPFAEDEEFRNALLEEATNVLQASVEGQVLLEPMASQDMNFIAAIWFAEFSSLQNGNEENAAERMRWLNQVKQTLPSCFCDTKDLGP